jgi:hypothetical protein
MASIAKVGTPSLSTAIPPTSCNISGFKAGEALAAGDAVYIKTSDGLIYRSTGAAANAAAAVDGFVPADCPIGEATSIYFNVQFYYGAALSPGSYVYLSGTVLGGLDTAPSTGGVNPIGRVIDATRIRLVLSY